jgi:SAM-dependent methyltransferase
VWIPTFACPECLGNVAARGSRYECARCRCAFDFDGHLFRFVTARRLNSKAAFLEQYRAMRSADGSASYSPAARAALPAVPGGDPRADEWVIRARTFARLQQILAQRSARPARALDLGAGNAWLSNRLAQAGHDPVALDLLDDAADGLGACATYARAFCAVVADFEALPFEAGQFDLVVFNASLHYAADAGRALRAAHRVLRPGGTVAVLDSPMFASADDGRAMLEAQDQMMRKRLGRWLVLRPGRGFLTFGDLERAAAQLGLRGRFHRSRGPLLWEMRRAASRLRLGRAPAAFGAWIAA